MLMFIRNAQERVVFQIYSITEYFAMEHFPGLGLYLGKLWPLPTLEMASKDLSIHSE